MKTSILSASLATVYSWALKVCDAAALHEVLDDSEQTTEPDWTQDPDYVFMIEAYVGELIHLEW